MRSKILQKNSLTIKKKKMYERYKENLCNVKGISFVETDLKKINEMNL